MEIYEDIKRRTKELDEHQDIQKTNLSQHNRSDIDVISPSDPHVINFLGTKIIEILQLPLNEQKEKKNIVIQETEIKKQPKKNIITATILINICTNNFPNAKNIEECLNKENITQDIIYKCYKMDAENGSEYILKKLCHLDIDKRPFHCTDGSRMNFIVKTNNIWVKDIKGKMIQHQMIPLISDIYAKINNEISTKPEMSFEKVLEAIKNMKEKTIKIACKMALEKNTTTFFAKNEINLNKYYV